MCDESVPDVGMCVTTGQPTHTHVLIVGVGQYLLSKIGQSLEQDYKGYHHAGTTGYNSYSH